MKELASEYKLSLGALNERITELKIRERELSLRQYSPWRESEMEGLKERLKPLNSMMGDLKAVIKEIEHYYDRGWWRSEEFTVNQR